MTLMVGQRFGLHSVKSPRMWKLSLSIDAFSSQLLYLSSRILVEVWEIAEVAEKNLDHYPPKPTAGKSLADTSVEKGVYLPGGREIVERLCAQRVV